MVHLPRQGAICGRLVAFATRYASQVWFRRTPQVFTGREPFYQYQAELRVLRALIMYQETPIPPTSRDHNGQIDDLMWDITGRCCNYVPGG